jgi:peroxiredoxin
MKKLPALLIAIVLFTVLAAFQNTGMVLKPNEKAPDFKLKNVDGSFKSFSDYKDAKGFIVVFTCNHCPFSQKYEERIIALHKQYASKGFPVIAINPNDPKQEPEDSYKEMQRRAKEQKYPFAYLVDDTQKTAKAYGATKTPHVFVIEKTAQGNIVRYIGAIDDNANEPSKARTHYVKNAIDEITFGKEVAVPYSRAIGCSIKWKS